MTALAEIAQTLRSKMRAGKVTRQPDSVVPKPRAATEMHPAPQRPAVDTVSPVVPTPEPHAEVKTPIDAILSHKPTLEQQAHGGEACKPCPSKGNCFLKEAIGDNPTFVSKVLPALDEPTNADTPVDPLTQAVLDQIKDTTIKPGAEVHRISFTNESGEEQVFNGRLIRKPGGGYYLTGNLEEGVPAEQSASVSAVSTATVETPSQPTKISAPETIQGKPTQETRKPESETARVDGSKTSTERVTVSKFGPSEPKAATTPSIAEKLKLLSNPVMGTETTGSNDGPGPATSYLPERNAIVVPITSDKKTKRAGKTEQQPPPIIDRRDHQLGDFDIRITSGTPGEPRRKRKAADEYTDHTESRDIHHYGETNNNQPVTRETHTRLIRTLPNILRAGFLHQEQRPLQVGATSIKDKAVIRGRVERSVPATARKLAELATKTATQILHDRVTTIVLREGPKKAATEKQTAQKGKETKRRKQTRRTEVIMSTISGEHMKLKKKKETLHGKKSRETISFKKGKNAEKVTKITTRKRKETLVETFVSKTKEQQRHHRRSILTEAGRAKIYERMRGRKQTETAQIKNKRELFKIETTRPLILILPKETPVEQIAGAIIRIAKEKLTKEKSPGVQITVSRETYQKLKKMFIGAIRTEGKSKKIIQIVSGDKKVSLDIEKLKMLENEFEDFEMQLLLLQLRLCLYQSEIREATVLCGCQQQDETNTFEKISFCQGCHQGYLQQAFFWFVMILWYTIYGMTLDQSENQLYTQSYNYEQAIFTS